MPCRSTTSLRVFLRVAILLAAGVLTSIAGAWGVELARAYRESNAKSRWILMLDEYGVEYDATRRANPQTPLTARVNDAFGRTSWHVESKAPHVTNKRPLPNWVSTPGERFYDASDAVAYGFPCRCMKYDFITEETRNARLSPPPGPESITTYFHSLRWWLGKSNFLARLPLHPLLPGLLLNTLFYATLFSTPYLFRLTRHHLRLRRGHCPACNYDLRANFAAPCSECGHSLPPRPEGART